MVELKDTCNKRVDMKSSVHVINYILMGMSEWLSFNAKWAIFSHSTVRDIPW